MKALQSVIVSNWVPYLRTRSVGSYRKSGREKEGKREGIESCEINLRYRFVDIKAKHHSHFDFDDGSLLLMENCC